MKIESQAPQTPGQQNYNTPTNARELSIDIWRGVAVFFMIMTHAIAFFHIGNEPVVNFLGTLGGTVSFGLFLFLSGIGAYYGFIKYDNETDARKISSRKRKLLYRSVWLLVGYYIVAIVASASLYSIPPSVSWVENLANTVLLINVPAFAEFLLPFLFYGLLIIPFRGIFKWLVEHPLALLIFGIAIYFLGSFLYTIETTGVMEHVKALLVGQSEWHRFPLFQYLIVYMLGMLWGKFISSNVSGSEKFRNTLLLILVTGTLIVIGNITYSYFQIPILEPLYRWPPSIVFMLIGLFVGYVTYLILQITDNFSFLAPLQVSLHFMGTNAFDFFFIHTILLFLYKYISNDHHYSSGFLVFILLFVLLLATGFLTIVKQSITESLKQDTEVDESFGWIFSERVIVTLVWVVIFFVAGLAIFQNNVQGEQLDPDAISFKKRLIREQAWPFWWDHAYEYFHQITIENASTANPISRNTWYSFNLNHKNLVDERKSAANGGDIRVVFYNENEDVFYELPLIFEGVNTTGSKISFKLQQDIDPSTITDKYFLYFGNIRQDTYPVAQDRPLGTVTEGIKVGELYAHQLVGSTNRLWYLKESTNTLQLKTLVYTVQLKENLAPESIVTYHVLNSDIRGVMDNLGGGKFQANVGINDLVPGEWQIQATAREPENKIQLIQSGYAKFLVSYPLYVVWTMDWEGWDVPDSYLAGINEMANRHDLPMTHFFNPRIYLTEVMPRARADELTLWVQNRSKNHGDEIGLHLHMFYNLVRAAGVTPRTNNYAPWLYGDGGGVAAYSYPVNEMKQILQWSTRQFIDNGFSAPISFRAGGWLAKENTLQALEESGFVLDSSGRTAFTSRGFGVPWDLSPTATPYKPNRSNINSTDAPTFDLWEFPNNGADSYWFDTKELIRRFDINYVNKGSILTTPQVLNYLSHPPFYTIDKPKMEQVFTHISKYLYKNDDGPIMYTTLENAYYFWKNWDQNQQ